MIQQELFDAHMIGDGCLLYRHKTKNRYPSFTITNKHKNYLKWVSQEMVILYNRPVWNRTYLDKRTNKEYSCHHIIALQRQEFEYEYTRWYSNEGKKDIPEDINVSREFLLHWYLDDGSLVSSGGIYLAVDSYTKDRVEILKDKLETLTGFKVGIHKNGKGFRLYFPTKYRKDFVNYLESCPVKEYEYKWS